MARMPGAEWKPVPASSTRISRYDLVIIHTCVGSLAGTYNYFKGGTSGANSHFCTGAYGEIWQFVDTAYRSAANAAANPRSVTIENADMGPGFAAWNTASAANVPAFTPQQIEANARICAWAHLEHGVPLVAADTSRPDARGIGFHRLGCDPYRVPDGERWSSAYGKVCPAPRRIAQIPQIIARAREIVNGDDMPDNETIKRLVWEVLTQDDVLERIAARVHERPMVTEADPRGGWGLIDRVPSIDRTVANYAGVLNGIAEQVRALVGQEPVPAEPTEGGGPAPTVSIDYDRIITGLADELDRRARDGDPSTGPLT